MHNRALHDALSSFVEEAAWQLAAEVSGGAEIPFELIEQGRSTRPAVLLPAADRPVPRRPRGRAAQAPDLRVRPLAASPTSQGVDDYLRRRGIRAVPPDSLDRSDLALQAFVTAVWADATDFVFEPERFNAAFRELEDAVYSETSVCEVLAPVDGLVIESERIELGGGLSLVRAATIHDAPEELRLDSWATVACVRIEGGDEALAQAGARLRRLQSALRLWDDAEPAVGPGAWTPHRSPVPGCTSRSPAACAARSTTACSSPRKRTRCAPSVALIDRRTPRGGELAWALRRFELGCERPSASGGADGLAARRPRPAGRPRPTRATRASPSGSPRSALRRSRAPRMTERLQRAVALERSAVAGLLRADGEVEELIGTLAGCLRAVLRDVLCGHLDPDLRGVADELLGGAAVGSGTSAALRTGSEPPRP